MPSPGIYNLTLSMETHFNPFVVETENLGIYNLTLSMDTHSNHFIVETENLGIFT